MEGTMIETIDDVAEWRITRDIRDCHERGSPQYWRAMHGRVMRDRNGIRLTAWYDDGDWITVIFTGGRLERWHRLSAAALDLAPEEQAVTLPTILPSQGIGA
jgi:hypothetical protein